MQQHWILYSFLGVKLFANDSYEIHASPYTEGFAAVTVPMRSGWRTKGHFSDVLSPRVPKRCDIEKEIDVKAKQSSHLQTFIRSIRQRNISRNRTKSITRTTDMKVLRAKRGETLEKRMQSDIIREELEVQDIVRRLRERRR
ncbi:hypothetical protein HUJ04_008181 [Dendroctonus ponderosae]|nr:hypothetical protein HUJ04_008181 [Dendroctonus ponderosae]